MAATAGFIQIGDVYYATVKHGRDEEICLDAAGERLPFDCFLKATAHARAQIAPKKAPLAAAPAEPDIVARWKEERARRMAAEREIVDRIGVEIVVKKRRLIRR